MSDLQLRPYQAEAINGLRQRLKAGDKRVILCAPTGSGKTEMAIHLIQEAQRKGSRVAFVADRVTLVEQTSQRLTQYGIQHGVAQAANTIGRFEAIQVCSAQTIEKRESWKDLDLLIIDECHTQRKAIQQFAVGWDGPVIGLSATPLTEGLGKTYQSIVNATTTDELLADEWLAPLKVFAAKEIGMSGAKKTAGEWQAGEVRERGRKILGDIVSEWVKHTQEHFSGPVPTLLFSADVAHGEELCKAFQMAGYDFRQSSYRDSQDSTTEMVEGFRAGEFTGLVSVEKFVKGFDVPHVQCMIGARPYSSSLASVIQQLGRGMRIAEGKEYCLYLDHAGNMAGWYAEVSEIWANGVSELPAEKKAKPERKEGNQREAIACHECHFVMPPKATECPYCGAACRARKTQAKTAPGRMGEVERPGVKGQWEPSPWLWQQVCRVAVDRKGGDAEAARKFAVAQYKNMTGQWPSRSAVLEPCEGSADEKVVGKIKQQLIAYFKGKAA